jgi:hypothetical protein
MSEATVILQNGSQLHTDYDFSKIFVFENKYRTIAMTATGDDLALEIGMLIGTIAASGEGAIMASAAVDGSAIPTGVCAETKTIAEDDTEDVLICIGGHVVEDKLIFDGTDDLDTIVSLRTYRDRIASDTLGIYLVGETELSAVDNA